MTSTSHVTAQLSDYCLGVLPQEDASRIAEHLLACRECRQEYDDVKLGVRLARELRPVEAPDSLWSGIAAASNAAPAGTLPFVRRSRNRSRAWQIAASLILLIGGGTLASWGVAATRASRWSVAALTGTPTIGSAQLVGPSRLVAGDWLITDSTSSANVTVGRIGTAEVAPNSRLRLVSASPSDHRLALERGSIHAKISAPPRLFVVETPAATAIDLGCEYTLDVDAHGASRLHVKLGWVALTDRSRQTLVPAGAIATTRPGVGVSIPYYEDATVGLRNGVLTLDERSADSAALATVLAQARRRDALTLWHIVPRVGGVAREQVVDRLATLVPMPDRVSRREVLDLDATDLDRWLVAIEPAWEVVRQPVWVRVLNGVWEYVKT